MKLNLILVLAYLFFFSHGEAQNFGCPLEGGGLLPKKENRMSLSSPINGATIFSVERNSVEACLKGLVADIIKFSEDDYMVVVKSGHITVAYRHLQIASVVKSQLIDYGSHIGVASKTDSVGYTVSVSIWSGNYQMNVSEILPCSK